MRVGDLASNSSVGVDRVGCASDTMDHMVKAAKEVSAQAVPTGGVAEAEPADEARR